MYQKLDVHTTLIPMKKLVINYIATLICICKRQIYLNLD